MGNLDTVPGIIKLYGGGGVLKKGRDYLPEHDRVHVEVRCYSAQRTRLQDETRALRTAESSQLLLRKYAPLARALVHYTSNPRPRNLSGVVFKHGTI